MKWRDFIAAALVELLENEDTVPFNALCKHMQLHWTRLCGDKFKRFLTWESYVKKILHHENNRDFVLHHNGRYSLRPVDRLDGAAESHSDLSEDEASTQSGHKRKTWDSPRPSKRTKRESPPESASSIHVERIGSASITATMPLAQTTRAKTTLAKTTLHGSDTSGAELDNDIMSFDKGTHLVLTRKQVARKQQEAAARAKADEARLFEARLQRVEARLEENFTALTNPNLWVDWVFEAPLYADLRGHIPITEAFIQHQVMHSHNAQLNRARWERGAYANYLSTIGFYATRSPLRHKYMQFRKSRRFTKENEERLLQRADRL